MFYISRIVSLKHICVVTRTMPTYRFCSCHVFQLNLALNKSSFRFVFVTGVIVMLCPRSTSQAMHCHRHICGEAPAQALLLKRFCYLTECHSDTDFAVDIASFFYLKSTNPKLYMIGIKRSIFLSSLSGVGYVYSIIVASAVEVGFFTTQLSQ